MITCPHCEAEIDRLLYKEDQRVFGSAYISAHNGRVNVDEHNEEDTEGLGGTEYQCPECEEYVSLGDLIIQGEEELTVEEVGYVNPLRQEARMPHGTQGQREDCEVYDNTVDIFINGDTTFCSHCKRYTRKEAGSSEVECEHCGKITKAEDLTKRI